EAITNLCTQTSHSINTDKTFLYANGAGQVQGYFDLPDNKFKSGTRIFKIQDAIDGKISSAESIYTTSGTNVNITTINHQHTETVVQKTTTVTNKTTTGWTDPVAQSFYVDTVETNRGVYIHSIDLYFDTIDPEHDVLFQVRKMTNGYHSTDLVYLYAWSNVATVYLKKYKN